MDEKTMRMQLLQQANQMLGMYTMPGGEPKHTPDEVMALAQRLYVFCTTGTMA
jgi:hypothetical protein